jgi:hypothetical protein
MEVPVWRGSYDQQAFFSIYLILNKKQRALKNIQAGFEIEEMQKISWKY